MILEPGATPLIDAVKSEKFILGGPEYGEQFSFADPNQVAQDIRAGYTPPADLTDSSRLIRLTREFHGNPRDQAAVDKAQQEKLHADLDKRHHPGRWKLARVISQFKEQRGNDSFWNPDYLVLLKPVLTPPQEY